METISFIMDITLLIGGVLAMYYASLVGGGIGHGSLRFMSVGFLVLGLAHLSETALLQLFPDIGDMGELIHRVIVLAGFALLLFGYSRLAKFVRS